MLIEVRSSELEQGDVVLCHGMRVRLDRPIEAFPSNNSVADRYPLAYHCRGLVENVEAIDDAWLVGMTREHHEWPNRHVPTGEHRWTIQGNDLVSWLVERDAL